MSSRSERNQGRGTRKFSIALAAAHFALSVFLVLGAARLEGNHAEWGGFLPWSLLFLLDFPVSGLRFILPDIKINALSFPFSDGQSFLWPALVHCVLGTAWYYFLGHVFRPRRKSVEAT